MKQGDTSMNSDEFKAKWARLESKLRAGSQDVGEELEAWLQTVAAEGEDFARAAWVGLIFGAGSFGKVEVRGTDNAEKFGFEIGVAARTLLLGWFAQVLQSKSSAEIEGFFGIGKGGQKS